MRASICCTLLAKLCSQCRQNNTQESAISACTSWACNAVVQCSCIFCSIARISNKGCRTPPQKPLWLYLAAAIFSQPQHSALPAHLTKSAAALLPLRHANVFHPPGCCYPQGKLLLLKSPDANDDDASESIVADVIADLGACNGCTA